MKSLGSAQVKREARRIAKARKKEPLRQRILARLAEGECTPSVLAGDLEVAEPSVSRLITPLRNAGLVEFRPVPGDGRARVYSLTPAGEVELSRHRAYDEPEPAPAAPDDGETVEFLYAALDAAVEMRRQRGDLEGAATRLAVVLRQARELHDGALVIEGLAELATTLRQCRAPDQVHALLDELKDVALGRKGEPLDDPTLVLPAQAHREYALGRLGDAPGDKMLLRADHLKTAMLLYGQLAAAPRHLCASRWVERQAWSKVALARNLRARSEFEQALSTAAEALQLFDEIKHPYGRSNCLFSIGVCLRLLGAFERALEWLDEALELAERHSFARFRAEALLQRGEVLRCSGDLGQARTTLRTSLRSAEDMSLDVTHAFARSALGAVAFHEQKLDLAREELHRAREMFANLRHREGMALTARRQAALTRALAREAAVNLEELEQTIAFSRACYAGLDSPPGVVACEIERGRLCILRDGEAPDSVAELLDLIDNRADQRAWVELDPWVPPVLCAFAEETGDDHFRERCWNLRESGRQKLHQRAEEGARRAAMTVGRREERTEEGDTDEREADDMAGEARQKGNQTTELAVV